MLQGFRHKRRIARFAWPVLLLFALRAGVPVGFMPAPLAAGGPFALCHGASAATLAMLDAATAAHSADSNPAGRMAGHGHADPLNDHEQAHDAHWEHCPSGVSSADVPLAHGIELTLVGDAAASPSANSVSQALPATVRRYLARAPPA